MKVDVDEMDAAKLSQIREAPFIDVLFSYGTALYAKAFPDGLDHFLAMSKTRWKK